MNTAKLNPSARLSQTVFPILLLIACGLMLTACGKSRQPLPARTPTLSTSTVRAETSVPTLVITQPDRTPPDSALATPSPTITQGPESFRLNPWDRETALRMLKQAGSVAFAEEYKDLREFYQVSIMHEVWLDNPELADDPDLIEQMAKLIGLANTYYRGYGLLHDHAVEPFRQLLEQALNNGQASLETLPEWVEDLGGRLDQPGMPSSRLFGEGEEALVIKVFAGADWDFFAIHQNSSGKFSVFALYPEWEKYWWNEETFQLTDLNNNGRDEIAVTREEWGTGSSYFCGQQFNLYEWDGTIFANLMADPIDIIAGHGACT